MIDESASMLVSRAITPTGTPLRARNWLAQHWLVVIAAMVCAAPGLLAIGRDVWSTEQGAHGPIIALTGLWLLWRETSAVSQCPAPQPSTRPTNRATPPTNRATPPTDIAALLAIAGIGAAVVACAIIGKVWLQWAMTYAALLIVYGLLAGRAALRAAWFPLIYLGFLIPPPPGIIIPLTRALKLGIADAAAGSLAYLGYDTASMGASLYVDSYELVVAAACAGLNSLTSLLAVGLLYAFLRHRAHPAGLLALTLCALPVAVLANFLRVVLLLLVTHYLGNALAQGMLHDAAGLTTFTLALGTMGLIDVVVVSPLVARMATRAALAPADVRVPGPAW